MAKRVTSELMDAEALQRARIGEYVKLHCEVRAKGAEFLWDAIEVGLFALVAKEGLTHGQFTQWLEDAAEMKNGPSVRQSRTYMAAAKRAEVMGIKSKTELTALLGDDVTLTRFIGSAKNALPSGGDKNPNGGDSEANGIGLKLASVLSVEESQVTKLSNVAVEYPAFGGSKDYETIIRARKTIMNKLRTLIGDD